MHCRVAIINREDEIDTIRQWRVQWSDTPTRFCLRVRKYKIDNAWLAITWHNTSTWQWELPKDSLMYSHDNYFQILSWRKIINVENFQQPTHLTMVPAYCYLKSQPAYELASYSKYFYCLINSNILWQVNWWFSGSYPSILILSINVWISSKNYRIMHQPTVTHSQNINPHQRNRINMKWIWIFYRRRAETMNHGHINTESQ